MGFSDEFSLIKKIARVVGTAPSGVLQGIGDDTAVLKSPRGALLATVDQVVEGVHFDLGYMSAEEVGHKALAVNLSDIAAMGGRPMYALTSLVLRPGTEDGLVEGLYRGMVKLARKFDVAIVGGNLTQSPGGLAVDVTLLGEAVKGRYGSRGGARPGDILAVTGTLGAAAAGLQALRRWGRNARKRFPAAVRAQVMPHPRIVEGGKLVRTRIPSALIDISDGLAAELHHMAEASGVGFVVDAQRIPLAPAAVAVAEALGGNAEEWALGGGEDYELLAAIPPGKWKSGISGMTAIGEVTVRKKGCLLRERTGTSRVLPSRGWNPFSKR